MNLALKFLALKLKYDEALKDQQKLIDSLRLQNEKEVSGFEKLNSLISTYETQFGPMCPPTDFLIEATEDNPCGCPKQNISCSECRRMWVEQCIPNK
jgi:hypothetical protein